MPVIKRLGKTLDATSITIIFGTTKIEAAEFSYGDKLNKEVGRRIGSQTVAYVTRGTYETEDPALKVEEVIWNADMLPRLPVNGFGNIEFTVIISAVDPDTNPATSQGSFTDTIQGVTIAGVKGSSTNAEGAIVKEIACKARQVLYDGKSLNTRDNAAKGGVANTMRL